MLFKTRLACCLTLPCLPILGKLFKSNDLPFIVEFILMFYRDKPVDWLLDHLLFVKVCNPEKDSVCIQCFFLVDILSLIFVA